MNPVRLSAPVTAGWCTDKTRSCTEPHFPYDCVPHSVRLPFCTYNIKPKTSQKSCVVSQQSSQLLFHRKFVGNKKASFHNWNGHSFSSVSFLFNIPLSILYLFGFSDFMQKAYPADLRHMTPIQFIFIPVYKCDLIRSIPVKWHIPAYPHRLEMALHKHPLHTAITWINKNIVCAVILRRQQRAVDFTS